ncbi:unnamed protein product, partial [Heterosigma akashiwo]
EPGPAAGRAGRGRGAGAQAVRRRPVGPPARRGPPRAHHAQAGPAGPDVQLPEEFT